jgi:hypothetical protein
MADKYGEAIIMISPGVTSRVYSPILTDEERARRMKQIKEAAARLIAAADLQKAERRNENESI